MTFFENMPSEGLSCRSVQEVGDIICYVNFSPYLPFLIVKVHLALFIGSMWYHHSGAYYVG